MGRMSLPSTIAHIDKQLQVDNLSPSSRVKSESRVAGYATVVLMG